MTGSPPVRANNGETNPARTAHVPPRPPSHARADEGEHVGPVHFVPWGSSEGRCGYALPPGDRDLSPVTDMRRETTCGDCQANMVDLRDFPTPVHSEAAHAAITAELVACTLGQRRHADRLELRTDLTGRVARAVQIVRRALHAIGAR